MRDLYNQLIEIPEGHAVSILKIQLGEGKLKIEADGEVDLTPIIETFINNFDMSKAKKGLAFELLLDMDEKGVNTTTYIDEAFKSEKLVEEVELLRQNVNKKFAELAEFLDQDPLFEETEFQFIFKNDGERYVYDTFVRTSTNISEHKALVRSLIGTYVFNEVTEAANAVFENEHTGLVKFKTNGITLKDMQFGHFDRQETN